VGRRRQQDRARIGGLLHAGGEIRREPLRGVVHAQVVADGTDDDGAAVEAEPDLDAEALVTPQPGGVLGEPALDLECRLARAPRVVLVSDRRAEERHDPVACELVDRALPAMHGVEHDLEGAVHDHVEVFGVEGSGQLGRALHVDEEDGHLLALAAKRASLGQDPLGQVTRCVGGGRADDGGGRR
jgi:hypothetical protein